MRDDLHARLIARQTTDELTRKQKKALRRAYWTQEDFDLAERTAAEMGAWFRERMSDEDREWFDGQEARGSDDD